MTTTDPVQRVMELLTDRQLTREHIMEAVTLLDDCRLRMVDGTVNADDLYGGIDEAVRLLDVAFGLPPDEDAAT